MDHDVEDRTEQYKRQRKLNSMLLLTCVRDAVDEVAVLIEAGAEVSAVDKDGYAALHIAAAHGRTDTVKLLWAKGAETETEDKAGRTPLHVAASKGHVSTITFLASSGAWVDAFDGKDDTPLHLAARAGRAAAVHALLAAGAKPHCINQRGLSALGEALLMGHTAAAALLHKAGAPLTERPQAYSLLHVAAGAGLGKSVQWLCDHGADVSDAGNSNGFTPLHCAIISSSPAAAEALLKAGANAAALDAAGKTPFDYLPAQDQVAVLAAEKREAVQKLGRMMTTWQASPATVTRSSPQIALSGSAPSVATSAASSLKDNFKSLSREEQHQRIDRWADKEIVETHVMLKGFTKETRDRIQEVAKLKRIIKLHKAVCLLHEDDDFQEDMRQPEVRAAIDRLQKQPDEMERHMANPRMRNVLTKLKRFVAFSKECGYPKVVIEELVPPAGVDYKALDVKQQAVFREMLQAQTAAAAAAACQDSEEAAKEAADAASRSVRNDIAAAAQAARADAAASATARSAIDPTKKPETWKDAFQLYWQELGDITWRNQEYRDAFVTKCIMSLFLLALGVLIAVLAHFFMPDFRSKLVRFGPGTFSPVGLLEGADDRYLLQQAAGHGNGGQAMQHQGARHTEL